MDERIEARQYGGDHYRGTIKHWDICERWDVPYLEGNATKYIERYDRKGSPVADLTKAGSYLAKAIETRGRPRRIVPEAEVLRWAIGAQLDGWKLHMMRLILCEGRDESLSVALDFLHGRLAMLERERPAEA